MQVQINWKQQLSQRSGDVELDILIRQKDYFDLQSILTWQE
jgi:hypothetical protein